MQLENIQLYIETLFDKSIFQTEEAAVKDNIMLRFTHYLEYKLDTAVYDMPIPYFNSKWPFYEFF